MPEISIIIPCLNAETTIQRCINSIISQTFTNFEIIVQDGKSQDGTIRIVEAFNDSRISIYSEKDNGVYDAMNKAIDKAKGEWLYFLGSDDALRDNDVLNNVAKELRKGDSDFVYGNAWFLKGQNKHVGEVDRKTLVTKTNICHQAIFYKKRLFQLLGKYSLEFEIWADWDFNIRCFSHPDINVTYIDLIIADYNDIDGLSARLVVDDVFVHLLSLDADLKVETAIETFKRTSFDYKSGRTLLKLPRKLNHLINKLMHRT